MSSIRLTSSEGWPPPNTRVQRTRVARCARPGSPLTRHPLGGRGLIAVVGALLLSIVLSPLVSCASPRPPRFGVVDEHVPFLSPQRLAEVNKEMTLGEIFRILGPAHWVPCTDALCYGWFFTDDKMLNVFPDSATPESRLDRFEVIQRP